MISYNFCINPYYYSLAETCKHIQPTSSTFIMMHIIIIFFLQVLTLHIVDSSAIKARDSLACLGWYPVYSCLSVRLHSGDCQLSNCRSHWWLLVTVPTGSCTLPSVHRVVPQQAHSRTDTYSARRKKNTQTYAAAHTYATRPSVVEHMMDGPMRDHFTSERPPLPLPFFLLPQSGYCVHIQTRYWVKCYLFARAVDIYRLPDMSSENQYRSWSFS